MRSWTDKRVIVTGGSSGVGLSTAEILASRGAHVALIARDRDRLEAAREAVAHARASTDQIVAAYPADVADWTQLSEAIWKAEEHLGPTDLLAACAGFCTPGRFTELDIEEFGAHLDVNLLGVIHAARAVAPGMMTRGSGHIAMVSSMGGLVGVYGYSAYSAAKFGVSGFAEVLRSEMKPHGVGVTLLCPPNMETPGYARELELEPPETAAINGMASALPPEIVARQFVRGIERDRFLVLSGLSNKLLYRIEGLWPELFFGVFDAQVSAARKKATRHE